MKNKKIFLSLFLSISIIISSFSGTVTVNANEVMSTDISSAAIDLERSQHEYLKDEKTVYPITIDPTIIVSYNHDGAGAIEDVTLNSFTPQSGTSYFLYVGREQNGSLDRMLMRFPNLSLDGICANQIISAKVYLTDLGCQSDQDITVIDKTKSDRKITFSYQKNEDKEVIRFEPLFDEDNSRKIYSELSDKEKEAQKYTAQLVGYKRLSDEQTNTLLNIIDENGNNIYWNKMMTVIGENNTDHRITMDYVQEVLDYVKKQNLLSKTDELDLIYDCFYRDHYYIDLTTGSGNVVDIFWIDQDEKQCIYLVNGNTLCYGEKVDGKLKEINRLV